MRSVARLESIVHSMKPLTSGGFPAGRLALAGDNWRKICVDPWVLAATQGYRIPWSSAPPRRVICRPVSLPQDQLSALLSELTELESKGAIERTSVHQAHYVSPLFLVPKSDHRWRVIFNLKSLNCHVQSQHFKMESLKSLGDLLSPDSFLCKLDLKDAYNSVPVADTDRPMFCFPHPTTNELWRYTCLPFGLSDAPRAFTKILTPVATLLRHLGVMLIVYLDDWLVIGAEEHLSSLVPVIVVLLERLGFVVNRAKSVLTASTSMVFLGVKIDVPTMTLSLPKEKGQRIQHECRRLLRHGSLSEAELRSIIGKLEATRSAIRIAPLYLRGLQYLLQDHLLSDQPEPIVLSSWAREDLQWWTREATCLISSLIVQPPVTVTITTDASNQGWGAVCANKEIGGRWHPQEATMHINWLELKAVHLGLIHFAPEVTGTSIRLEMDNTTAVSYVNRKGGTRSRRLCQLAQEIWQWAAHRQLNLVAFHVPGVDNVRADFQSRHFQTATTEWMLSMEIFQCLAEVYHPLNVDLFAARHNAQLPDYVSWKPDPLAQATDAFSCSHLWEDGYAFPPFNLVGLCLQTVRQARIQRLLLVAPVWPHQTWYPVLLSMLVSPPLRIPSRLTNPAGSPHPLGRRLQLAAWPVSGVPSSCEAFQNQLQTSGRHRGGHLPKHHMIAPGESGLAGVTNTVSIPFRHLSLKL